MARIDLNVPYAQKDEAKSLGARWDPQAKVWYIPEGTPSYPLSRWLPKQHHEPEFFIRSPYYYIVESVSDCWKCHQSTAVFSFVLPEEHEEFQYIDDDTEEPMQGEWQVVGNRGTALNVNNLSPAVLKRIYQFTKNFKLTYSKMADSHYFMNHCQYCNAKLGDFFMHSEPGGAFFPMTPEHACQMILFRINERFDANCSVSYATEDFIDCMQLVNN